MEKKIFILPIHVLLCFIVCSVISLNAISQSHASSGTIYETEYNGSYSSANNTYDDYDNYGTIYSTADIDWWHVSFSQESK